MKDYEVIAVDEHIVVGVEGHYVGDWPERREACLLNKKTGKQEQWFECDADCEKPTLLIDGTQFEFIKECGA